MFIYILILFILINACNDGYNLSRYSQYKTINSEVAKQRNSTLRKLDSKLAYVFW